MRLPPVVESEDIAVLLSRRSRASSNVRNQRTERSPSIRSVGYKGGGGRGGTRRQNKTQHENIFPPTERAYKARASAGPRERRTKGTTKENPDRPTITRSPTKQTENVSRPDSVPPVPVAVKPEEGLCDSPFSIRKKGKSKKLTNGKRISENEVRVMQDVSFVELKAFPSRAILPNGDRQLLWEPDTFRVRA